jgi:hypothetical protein
VPARRHIATWGAFVLGLLIIPLFVLALGSAVRRWSEGADLTGEDGVALVGARDLAAAVDRYLGHYQHVPDPKQGLNALVPEFIEYVPNDPWNNPYVYEATGPNWADVLSYGADGRAGGGGSGADISARFGRLGGKAPGYLRPLASIVIAGLALAAALSATKRRWCAYALAGMSAFWAVMLLVTASPPQGATLRLATLPVLSFITGLACLVGAFALLRELPNAPRLALVSIVSAYILLQYLVAA